MGGGARPPVAGSPSGSVWGNRNFRLFFGGQLVSNVGTWLHTVAQGVLVLQLTGSSFMVGVAGAALFLPVVFLSLHGGRLADRFDRRRLLIATQLLALTATGTLAVLAATGRATVVAVIAVAAAVGIQYAVSIPTLLALLPALVEPGQLGQAIGMNSVTYNAARVLGPVASTGAIAVLGFGWAFGLNSLSYLALIAALLLLRLNREPVPGEGRGSVREAVTHAWRDRRLRLMLAGVAAVSMASDPIITLAPAFVTEQFGRRAADAGLIAAAFGLGAVGAALSLARAFRRPAGGRYRLAGPAMLAYAGGMAGFAFAPSIWPALAALTVAGAGFLTASTTWTTGIQEEVPEAMRGRIMGLWTLCFLGSRPLASLVGGAVSDLAGPPAAVLALAVPLVVVAVLASVRLSRPPAPVPAVVPPGPG